jgi:hypothetical protein
MRTFKKGDNILKTNDLITIKALLNSGYEEIIEIEEVQEYEPKAKPKKRSKLD